MVAAPLVKGVELSAPAGPVTLCRHLSRSASAGTDGDRMGVALDARRGAGQGLSRDTKTIDASGD